MNIVALEPPVKDAVYQYRMLYPLQSLALHGHNILWAQSIPEVRHLCDGADLLVVMRPDSTDHVVLIQSAKLRGIQTIVDVDDAVYDIPVSNPYYVVWGERKDIIEMWQPILRDSPDAFSNINWAYEWDADTVWRQAQERRASLTASILAAKLLTVSTNNLAKYFKDWFTARPRNISVLLNAVNRNDFKFAKKEKDKEDTLVRVRWGGSVTHYEDLRLLVWPMEHLMEFHPNIHFSLMGVTGLGKQLFANLPDDRFESLSGLPHEQYLQWLSEADIILAPSNGSLFDKCKSDLRVIQAGMVQVPVVSSPATYGETVKRAGMGFVAQQKAKWVEYTRKLSEDAMLRRELGNRGHVYVQTLRTYQSAYTSWENTYSQLG